MGNAGFWPSTVGLAGAGAGAGRVLRLGPDFLKLGEFCDWKLL